MEEFMRQRGGIQSESRLFFMFFALGALDFDGQDFGYGMLRELKVNHPSVDDDYEWEAGSYAKHEEKRHERPWVMLARMRKDSPFIVIMDRGYESHNMIETLNRTENCSYILRSSIAGGFKEVMALPDKDCDTDISIRLTVSSREYKARKAAGENIKKINAPKRHYKEAFSEKTTTTRWDFETVCDVKFRAVKFRINDPDTGKEVWEVLITNLNRFEFPAARLKEMYHLRWKIETSFRDMKYSLGAMNFHSRKDGFIRMELLAHLIMFNVVARNVAVAEISQKVRRYEYAIDFKMACAITRDYFRLHCAAPISEMYEAMGRHINPIRPDRQDERNVKRKSAVPFEYRIA